MVGFNQSLRRNMSQHRTTLVVPKMDCPTEEILLRGMLIGRRDVSELHIDLSQRTLAFAHEPGSLPDIRAALKAIGFETVGPNESPTPARSQSGSRNDSSASNVGGSTRLELYVENLDCENDAAAIRRAMEGYRGVAGVAVFPKAARVSVEFDPRAIDREKLAAKLAAIGFPVRAKDAPAGLPKPWRNPKVVASALSGLLLLAGWIGSLTGFPAVASTEIYLVAIVVGGYHFGREALEDLIFDREVGIELLMSVAAIVATLMGQPAEGAMLVFLYSISEAAEGYTEEKTRAAVRALMNLAPKVALLVRDGTEIEVPVEELRVGDEFLVKPGQAMATDGVIVSGTSSVNEAPVTGESMPVEKHIGDMVFAASLNGQGGLRVRATKTFAENTLSRIVHMVEEAQERKGSSQRFIDRFGKRYSPAVLLIGVLIAVIPPLLLGGAWDTWILRATVFIVAAAPCALVISIPITVVAALGTAARNGVLIKGGLYVEELARIKVVALDKTGTLTRGAPEVTDVLATAGIPVELVLSTAAGVEAMSEHPLAKAIVGHTKAKGVTAATATDFQALTGAGARAHIDNRTVYVGSPELFETQLKLDVQPLRDVVERLQAEGKTVVLVGDENAVQGLIAIQDRIRANAKEAIEALKAAGIERVVMLTGDNQRTANAIARELGINEIHAGLKPEDKVARVRELASRHGHIAMVGDGVNDAPALAEATVGVAMGAAGTDVALETADVALMADNLEKLAYALQLAKRNRSIVNQNLVLSVVVIGALVVGALAGVFSLPAVVIGHELSEFIVIASGLRMLRS